MWTNNGATGTPFTPDPTPYDQLTPDADSQRTKMQDRLAQKNKPKRRSIYRLLFG